MILSQTEADLRKSVYYRSDLFAETSSYLLHNLANKLASKLNATQLEHLKTAGGLARGLYETGLTLEQKSQALLNSFNKLLMRWPLDPPQQSKVDDTLKKIGSGFGAVQMLTTDVANAAMFRGAADCVVNKKPLSIVEVRNVRGSYAYTQTSKINEPLAAWFEKDFYRHILYRLTGKIPPKLAWKTASVRTTASNLTNVDEVNSYLNGVNTTGATNCEMIYQGIDNIRIDLGSGMFRQALGPWDQMTETGSSRRHFAKTVLERERPMKDMQVKRRSELAKLIESLKQVEASLNATPQ